MAFSFGSATTTQSAPFGAAASKRMFLSCTLLDSIRLNALTYFYRLCLCHVSDNTNVWFYYVEGIMFELSGLYVELNFSNTVRG